ncbi:MAG: Rne/Rng family ribonuclease [Proteobacteria bacterium]|nr:Rne/Rng family ribonuclease [Pseudomonadota bacterium]MBU1452588.1 Rne/Rng family ribonuclease [Pseudomonadota bacterium]MBU2517019.1 Rne/Rng family ribonuclease [Pseudomonadota bacterium]
MSRKMLINATGVEELRVAVVEEGRLEAFYVETAAQAQTRGNIYKGVVANVEPSLQAAFIDYGRPKHGFLQIADLRNDLWDDHQAPSKGLPPLQEVLKKGRQLLVQVVKEETGNKGAALTTHLSIPGQYLVLTPGHSHVGVSRQIADEKERSRIKEVLESLERPGDLGVIARTAAEGRSKRDLTTNLKQLLRLWEDLEARGKAAKPRSLIHKEEELAVRTVRDLFTSDLSEILVDDPEVLERVSTFVGTVNPRRKKIVKLYQQQRPIFAKYDLEEQISSVYQPAVRLPSGGSIVISPTEALVAVDVNSGKTAGGKQLEDTALAVNNEAAAEIARQLRLRDLGGLIVIDFIDMRDRANQRNVRKALMDALKGDKAKTTVGHISRFGLLEMSRQRIRPAIDFGSTRTCPVCQGRGLLLTTETLGRRVLRGLELKLRGYGGKGLKVRLAPETAHYLQNVKRAELSRLEDNSGVCLELVIDSGVALDDFKTEACGEPWSVAAPAPHPEPAAPPAPTVSPAPAPARQGGGQERLSHTVSPAPAPALKPGAPEPAAADAVPPKPAASGRKRRRSRKKPAAPAEGQSAAEAQPQPEAPPATPQASAGPPAEKPAAEANNGQPAGQDADSPPAPKKRRRRRPSGAQRRARAKANKPKSEGEEPAA